MAYLCVHIGTDKPPAHPIQMESKAPAKAAKAVAPKTNYTKKYLSFYNALSAVLWADVLFRLMVLLPLAGFKYVSEGVAPLLIGVQSMALLEVVHVALGFVRSSPITVLMQVASRLFLVWGVLKPFPTSAATPVFSAMVFAWCITELVRYPYYWSQLRGYTPKWLEFLRYNLFFVLYPIGASSEVYLTYRALPLANYYHPFLALIMKIVMIIYPPAFYVLFTHMIRMRSKAVSSRKKQ